MYGVVGGGPGGGLLSSSSDIVMNDGLTNCGTAAATGGGAARATLPPTASTTVGGCALDAEDAGGDWKPPVVGIMSGCKRRCSPPSAAVDIICGTAGACECE